MSKPTSVDLHFEDSGKWYSLPEWVEYFISLGRFFASATQTERRIFTAIIVPTRAFGAAFISLGMIIGDASSHEKVSEAAHFKKLLNLPHGTPVFYYRKKGVTPLKGMLQAPEEHDGMPYIRVQVNSQAGGGTTYFINETQSLKVHPAGERPWKLPKRQRRSNVRTSNKFVDSLFGDVDSVQNNQRSKIVSVLVGQQNVLDYEIRKTILAVHVNGILHAKGNLQDILRMDSFVNPRQPHRSAFVSIRDNSPSIDVINNIEIGVVFDGAVGFLKWGKKWCHSHQVVILDRTESYFDDAVSAINARFSQNSIHGGNILPEGKPPPGGEILAFWESIK
jgi:hypothetical protein